MKIQTSEIMGRRNNKEAVSTLNPMITELSFTEMLRAPEEKNQKDNSRNEGRSPKATHRESERIKGVNGWNEDINTNYKQ